MRPPRKGTPEYDAWLNSPEREEWIRKIKEARKRQVFTDETRTRLSEVRKGHPVSEETRRKLSEAQKGKPRWSEEDRKKMSLERKGRKASEESKAKKRGYVPSKEARAKISAGNKGKKVSEETRTKIGKFHRGKDVSGETRAKLSLWWHSLPEDRKQARIEKLRAKEEGMISSRPEEIIATRLDVQGTIYERQKQIGWYKVDFYIPVDNRVIEVNGCFWHACEQCGFEHHKKRRTSDAQRYDYLRRKGYTIEVIWEHDLKYDIRRLKSE